MGKMGCRDDRVFIDTAREIHSSIFCEAPFG